MDFIFADDSRQKKPSRKNIKGPLLAIGGIYVPGEQVGHLEKSLKTYCESIGFPQNEQFKWSPGKSEEFQKEHLNDDKRIPFFNNLLEIAAQHKATATVVVVDASKSKAYNKSKSNENDVTILFLERCHKTLHGAGRVGVPIIAKPSGGSTDENKFIADCLEVIQTGNIYVNFKSLAIGVLTAPSKQIRLLQLADIVTSCTVARVSGESQFSPSVFEKIKPLFQKDGDRIGGIGLKIHPDYTYANLYYWLLGDNCFRKGNQGYPLPKKNLPFAESSCEADYKMN
jgi:hypothetical protein